MSVPFHAARAEQPNNFDFIRLMLAMLVLYSHCYPLGTGTEAREPIYRLTHGQMTGGAVAVDLFFVMSGFLITASMERSRSLRSFFRKRVARIYPAFVVASAFDLLVVLPLSGGRLLSGVAWSKSADVFIQTLRLREFSYTGAFASNPYPGAINGSLWSIQFEFWCYVGVAGLAFCGLMRRRALLLAALLTSIALSVMFQLRGWVFGGKWLGVVLGSPQLWARLLPLYLAGVVFYLWRDRIRLSLTGFFLAAAGLLAGCILPYGCAALFPVAGTYVVFWFAFSPQVRLYRFGRFGDLSYGTYLYAFPVEQLLMKTHGQPITPLGLLLCALPITLLMAAASWYGVERRFLRAGRRKRLPFHEAKGDA